MYIGETRNPVTVILLSIITLGIYALYWYYTIMVDLNMTIEEERFNPVLMLILSIICFPLFWVILYKTDKGLEEISQKEGLRYKENFILWLLLTLVFGIGAFVALYQITEAYNNIWAKRSGNVGTVQ